MNVLIDSLQSNPVLDVKEPSESELPESVVKTSEVVEQMQSSDVPSASIEPTPNMEEKEVEQIITSEDESKGSSHTTQSSHKTLEDSWYASKDSFSKKTPPQSTTELKESWKEFKASQQKRRSLQTRAIQEPPPSALSRTTDFVSTHSERIFTGASAGVLVGSCILNPPLGAAATGIVVASRTSLAVGFLASEAEQYLEEEKKKLEQEASQTVSSSQAARAQNSSQSQISDPSTPLLPRKRSTTPQALDQKIRVARNIKNVAAVTGLVSNGTQIGLAVASVGNVQPFVNLGTPTTTTNNLACASVAVRDLGKSAIAKLSK